MERFFLGDPVEALGRDYSLRVGPDIEGLPLISNKSTFYRGVVIARRNSRDPWSSEVRVLSVDGTTGWIYSSLIRKVP